MHKNIKAVVIRPDDYDQRQAMPVVYLLHGYSDAQDYYRRASSRYYLPTITTPTLLIQAEDDPFIFRHSLPEASELALGTELELHAKGGHVGFVEAGSSWREPIYYLERRIPQFLQAMAPDSVRVAKLADSLPPAYQSSSMRKAAP